MVIRMPIKDVPGGVKVYCPTVSKKEIVVIEFQGSFTSLTWVSMQINGVTENRHVASDTVCYVDDQDLKSNVRGWIND